MVHFMNKRMFRNYSVNKLIKYFGGSALTFAFFAMAAYFDAMVILANKTSLLLSACFKLLCVC